MDKTRSAASSKVGKKMSETCSLTGSRGGKTNSKSRWGVRPFDLMQNALKHYLKGPLINLSGQQGGGGGGEKKK